MYSAKTTLAEVRIGVALGGGYGGIEYSGVFSGSEGPYLDLVDGNTHVSLGKKSLNLTFKMYAVYCM